MVSTGPWLCHYPINREYLVYSRNLRSDTQPIVQHFGGNMSVIEDLGHSIFQITLIDLSSPYRSTGYLVKGEKTVIVETGASPSNQAFHSAFKELLIEADEIDYIAVTHVHLDHAGGAGLLMSQCPNATLLVHEKGAPHMIDPGKLIAGARQVYGDSFDAMFDPILPVPEERVRIMNNNEPLELGGGRVLRFLDTPGHAFHHLVMVDSQSNGVFSGDAAGMYFKELHDQEEVSFCMPVTAPTQFAPDLMDQTLAGLIEFKPECIYFTHFGMAKHPVRMLEKARELSAFFGDDCVEHFKEHRSQEALFAFIEERILAEIQQLGVKGDFPERKALKQDILLNIQGIIAYVQRLEKS